MSDFSSFALFTAGLAIFAKGALAQGIVVPGGSNPTAGSVVSPAGADIVPVGSPWTIKWTVKTEGCGSTVDLALLKKNPNADYVDGYSWIAKGVPNSAGSYSWTPDSSLEPGTKLWGIELICTETQAYQYTERFGISNSKYQSGGTTTTTSSGPTTTSCSTSLTSSPSTTCTTLSTTKKHKPTSSAVPYPVTTTGSGSNSTTAYPTGTSSVTVTTSVPPTTTSAAPATTTTRPANAAGHIKASFGGLVAAAAVAVFAL